VIRVQGTADYSLDGGHTWFPIVVGKYFEAGSLIRSGDKSIVDVLIGKSLSEKTAEFMQFNTRANPAHNVIPQKENNMIRLRPNTTLGVDKLTVSEEDSSYVSDAELNLKSGRIFASVRKVSPSSVYLIKIPDGVAAVRGTQLQLDTDGSSSSCSVSSGTVWLSFSITDASGNPIMGPDGNPFPPVQVTLTPGQSFNLTQGLLNNLSQQLNNAASTSGNNTTQGTTTTVTQTQINNLVTLITAAATGNITTLTQTEINSLAQLFQGPITITITPGQAPSSSLPPPPTPPTITTSPTPTN
jgi:hypothetical protein